MKDDSHPALAAADKPRQRAPMFSTALPAILCVFSGSLFPTAVEAWPQQIPRPTPPVGAPRTADAEGARITGRLVAEGAGQPGRNTEVRIETVGGTRVAFAYTDGRGGFEFRDVRLEPNESYRVTVEAEGFEPYSENLDYRINRRFGGDLTILLEFDRRQESAGAGGSAVVDLSQLAPAVSDETRREYERALASIEDENHEDAVRRLSGVVAMAPDFFDAYDALGAAYLTLERYREAEAALGRAHELSPASARPLLNLGTLHYKEGEAQLGAGLALEATAAFRKAVEYLDDAVRRDPLSGMAHHHLGAALYRLNEHVSAERALQLALDLDPDSDDPRLVLINVFTRQLRYEEALRQLALYLERNPDSPQREALSRLRAQIQARQGADRAPGQP